jgi:hypothetical protein
MFQGSVVDDFPLHAIEGGREGKGTAWEGEEERGKVGEFSRCMLLREGGKARASPGREKTREERWVLRI